MSEITFENAGKQPFLRVIQSLVKAFQAFTLYDSAGLREYGLTQSQADVIFTLGNTEGMTFREIGEQTLITKGTLTGVIDRLEGKGLVRRIQETGDRRCTRVELTNDGNTLFQKVFPAHIEYLKQRFDQLPEAEQTELSRLLFKLQKVF